MSRTLILAALLTVAAGPAQAASPSDPIHQAAVKACAAETGTSLPVSYYNAITRTCVDRVEHPTMRQMQAAAEAKTKASTAALSD